MNKKLILGIGTMATLSLPLTVIVACDSKKTKQTRKQKEWEKSLKKSGENTEINKNSKVQTGTNKKEAKVKIEKSKIEPIHFNEGKTKEKIQDYLTSGLDSNITTYSPLDVSEVTKEYLTDPNSVANFNYAGAIGIINAVYKNTLGSSLDNDMNKSALKNIQAILKALLLDNTILENKVGQNLNSQKVAQSFFKELDSKGIEALASLGTLDSKVLVFKKGNQNKEKQNVRFTLMPDKDGNVKVAICVVFSSK